MYALQLVHCFTIHENNTHSQAKANYAVSIRGIRAGLCAACSAGQLLGASGEVGKKLDFLLQEMNREANTLLSKTAGVSGKGTRITELGLAMKAEIEKAREQIQNVE